MYNIPETGGPCENGGYRIYNLDLGVHSNSNRGCVARKCPEVPWILIIKVVRDYMEKPLYDKDNELVA